MSAFKEDAPDSEPFGVIYNIHRLLLPIENGYADSTSNVVQRLGQYHNLRSEPSGVYNPRHPNFFIRPNLRIQFDPRRDIQQYTFPSVHGNIVRRYIKIRVINRGRGTAQSCRGQLTVIPTGNNPMRYPSTQYDYILLWGRLSHQSDLSIDTISARTKKIT